MPTKTRVPMADTPSHAAGHPSARSGWRRAISRLHEAALEAESADDLERAIQELVGGLPGLFQSSVVALAICSRDDPCALRVWGASSRTLSAPAVELRGCVAAPDGHVSRLLRGENSSYFGPEALLGLVLPTGPPALSTLLAPEGASPLRVLAVPLVQRSRVLGLFVVGAGPSELLDERLSSGISGLVEQCAGVVAQFRLLEAMEHRERETWALYRVGEAVNGSFDLEEVLSTVVQESMALLGADAGALLITQPIGSRSISAFAGESSVLQALLEEDPAAGLPGQVAREGRALWTSDWPGHPSARTPEQAAAILASGLQSLLCVPLRHRGDACGSLSLAFRSPMAFTPRQVDSLANIARQAAVAIGNFHLLDSLMRRAFELSAIQEVGAAVMGQCSLEEFLTLVARKAAELASVENGAVCFASPDRKSLAIVAASGPAAEQSHGLNLPLAALPGGARLAEGEPLFLSDLSALVPAAPLSVLIPGVRALLAVPLRIQEEFLGSLLVLQSQEQPALNQRHAELLQLFASQASIAIKNARLLQSISAAKTEWERTFDSITDHILLLDPSGRVTRCNRAFARWMSAPVADLIGQRASELFERVGGCVLPDETLTAGETMLREVEMPRLAQTHLMTSSPLQDADGRLLGTVHISKDVTEQTRLRAQLGESEKLRALGEMAGGVAHDFNNLLTSILGNAQVALRDPAISEAVSSHLRTIENGALDGAETVKRLKTFAKRLPGSRYQPLSLSDAALDALEITRPRWRDEAEALGIRIDVTTSLPPLPQVLGNPAEIREVITNLIINSVQAMPRGGEVELRTWQQDGSAWLSVRDTGVGMSPEVLKRVFEPFFTTKGDQGTGLGLSVSHSIIRQHGGDVMVESRYGRGSTFYLRLPLYRGQEPASLPSPVTREDARYRILAVDDQAPVRQVIGSMLESAHHEVLLAKGGAEALDLLAALARERGDPAAPPVDLVVTDLGMPGMTGAELASRLRTLYPDLPIILLTGWGGLPDQGKLEAKVDRVLAKPIDLDALLDAIQTVVRRAPGPSPAQ